mmetsp:Transcript_15666/g.44727  ORF Transcript_15666/g.44727 Transcript_15666/m.44727 type:complete len:312 (+) Transcript_15666:73-1008(+)
MSGGRDSRSDVRVGGKKNDESAPGLETAVVLDCDLDLRNSSRKVWLVKVPEFVAKTWREALSAPDSTPATGGPEERVQLASLTLSNSNRSFSLSLNPELNASSRELCEDGLADLDLVLQQGSSQAADQMLVAVRDQGWPKHGTEKDGGQAGIEESLALQMRYVDGVVQHRLDVDPTSLMKKRKYAKVSRSRFSAAESASRHDEQKQKRKIQVMTDAKIVDIRKPIGADNRKALAKKSGFLEKRVAMESQELLAILFGLFSKQSRWTFGQLQKETLQPTQHLKSVLGQIARLNKVGPYKGTWELTKESTVHE